MRADNVGAPATQAQWNFIHHQGRNLRTSLEGVANVFAPSCISHTVLTKPSWTEVTVDGVSLPDALQCWVDQDHPGERALAESSVPMSQPPLVGGYLRPVQADSPHTSFKRLNVDLIKSIDKYQSNSMGHRTKKMRHKPNIVHNRTNKRNKNRRKRNKRRCHYGETLESKIRCAKEENEVRRRREKSGRSLGEVERSNRDLLRSIQRGGSMLKEQKQRRRRRRKRQRRVSSEQRVSKEERRQLRRQERRRLKKEEKRRRQKQGLLSPSSRRQGRRLSSSSTPVLSFAQLSAHFSREQQRRLAPRSIQVGGLSSRSAGQCKARHVDVCSWPQCNRSCPKLHNPMTGETCL